MEQSDTIVAVSTPPGLGAIGLIRLSGPAAVKLVDRVFSKNIAHAKGYSLHYGQIHKGKNLLDDVVVSIFRGPRSFTRQDVCEVSFHGSPFILQEALSLFLDLGARLAEPGEFTQRAFLNGAMDLAQAEAVADLIASTNSRSHNLAMQQMRGGVSDEIGRLRDRLLHFTSLLELELDFAEEDVEFVEREQLLELVRHIRHLAASLAETFRLGNAIKEGIVTVIAGRPNAGKSTLLNALLQEERAIVSDIPGTTRDTIEENIVLEGLNFRLIDTAGIRDATDKIEAIGVERTYEKVAGASVLLYMYDVTETSLEEVEKDLSGLVQEGLEVVVLANKVDLWENGKGRSMDSGRIGLPGGEVSSGKVRIGEIRGGEIVAGNTNSVIPDGYIQIAANRGGDSLGEVKAALVKAGGVLSMDTNSVIISNVRHYDALRQAAASLAEAEEGIGMGVSQELVALDIRHAAHYLGEITGEITTDEVLGNIFSKFCIGK